MAVALVAIIRIRGVQGARWRAKRTMEALHLTRRHHMVLLPENPALRPMLNLCKDYVAWGEVDPEVVAKLNAKMGEKAVYRMHPPRKGFRSVKKGGPKGALGNIGKRINNVIERMLPM
jgi:large subunit ribosomal protein L30